ncbi:MAG: hypothetical protein QXF88_01590 [Candidatus Aenigmatarchaeota archaeon]
MAELLCSISEFNKYIGPRIRNRIQSLTKKRKKELDYICQLCKKKKEIEAAHKIGKSRKDIIKKYFQNIILMIIKRW